jgi:hypothetical protein
MRITRAVAGPLAVALWLAAAAASPAGAAAALRAPQRLADRDAAALAPRPRHGALTRRRVANLRYHGGPVMRTNTTYAIFWDPPAAIMGPGYQAAIARYFEDVAGDSGATTNVYAVETQYYDTSGRIAYDQEFGGVALVTDDFPSNGCPPYAGMTSCVTDRQVQAKVKQVVAANGWVADEAHAYFVFLPKNVGTCIAGARTACAFTDFCAYHSFADTATGPLIYANEPYAQSRRACRLPAPGPRGSEADATINTASHEHREMINDPLLDAWFDRDGNEGSDKCAWRFGTVFEGTVPGTVYNQVISGNQYLLQKEWSNAIRGCALTA